MLNPSISVVIILVTLVDILSPRFCSESVLLTKPVKHSYLEALKVAKATPAAQTSPATPLICTKYETVVMKMWKVEKVTARVTMKKCCAGYSKYV